MTDKPSPPRDREPIAEGATPPADPSRHADVAATDLLTRYGRPLYAYARLLGLSDANAQDVMQETLATAWRKRASGRLVENESAWIYRVCRNAAYTQMRSAGGWKRWFRHGRPTILTQVAVESISREVSQPTHSSPLAGLTDAEQDAAVRAAVLKLALPQREVVVLHYFGGLSLAECAAVLELPGGTVKSRLARGLAELKEILLDAGIIEGSAKDERETRPCVKDEPDRGCTARACI